MSDRTQVVVVSGATSDIARAISERLARRDTFICLLGRRADALDEVAAQLRRLGGRCDAYVVDLMVDDTIQAMATRLGRQFGRVDVLVHSAGAFAMGSLAEAKVDDFDRLYRTNVRGPYQLTRALLDPLRASRGQVVFLNSTVGLHARSDVGQYAATQHGLRALADSLRAEVNRDGVRVLNVFLGRTATARQARIFELEGREYKPELLIQPDDVAQMVVACLDIPATAEVTEIRMRPLVKSY
ncbi:MAG TPA: SDR family NAD(P)-dependent oxidoreductase [Gemmatimonadaceae bacterium]|nr:SDR family NAD(P)-dependent oxidoreductase [Gemmatimonadaceae bacterium]